MCRDCVSYVNQGGFLPRRDVLKLAGGFAASLALSGLVAPGVAAAKEKKEKKAPPKPENIVSPDAALERLLKGNGRYVDGVSKRHDFKHEREALAKGQNPFAGILSCADSRIAPEYAFDTGRGDLFVCRVAGNFANEDTIASFEYAIHVLKTPLLMVLGHAACGAVDAAITSIRDNSTLPGHLPSLVEALAPAVRGAMNQSGSQLDNTIRQNVVLNVEKLKTATPIISKAVDEGKVKIVGGIYNLENGKVALVG
ncbi:carbonic anhydrase [Methylocapsa palsarum]|uniref:Carbonic anhydrase n=1 Tax=Methylocapsa palsarum TaxID=1612308 RepID=A0A1I3W1D0_9HYPH|nr:carbonic anhydrase [Methylocapsa palsarum]SFK00437.1 carbonic anhydrase [Methylocapsa palsarum]